MQQIKHRNLHLRTAKRIRFGQNWFEARAVCWNKPNHPIFWSIRTARCHETVSLQLWRKLSRKIRKSCLALRLNETLLKNVFRLHSYTIYPLTPHQAKAKHWIENTTLLVVCGYVSQDIGDSFTEYFLNGGYMISVCSDLLHSILPTFRSHAEVREHELVQFSYGRWHKVKMMHHIFCYQPSPVKKHFSTDSEDILSEPKPYVFVWSGRVLRWMKVNFLLVSRNSSAKVCPKRSVELCDQQKVIHNLQVQILGTEETWNTPSLLLASDPINSGVAIFSQVSWYTVERGIETVQKLLS